MTKTDKQKSDRAAYISPSVEIIKLENEGIIAASAEDYNQKPMTRSGSSIGGYPQTASGTDLEDFINDILTVEN